MDSGDPRHPWISLHVGLVVVKSAATFRIAKCRA